MKRAHKISIGTRIFLEGDKWKIIGFVGGDVELLSAKGERARYQLGHLQANPNFKILGDSEFEPLYDVAETASILDAVPQELLSQAHKLEAHLLEALTGYSSGNQLLPLPNEPREIYDPELTTLNQRIQAKAGELKISTSSLWRKKRKFEQQGLAGLLDERRLQPKISFGRIDDRVKQAMILVLDDITDQSNITFTQIRVRVAKRLKAISNGETVQLPSEKTLNKLIKSYARGRGTFGSAKNRRSIANRPSTPYRRFSTTRAGEVVLIDSTPLDVYAIDPDTLRWLPIQLTIGYDVYTRSIVGWRLTPVSTQAVDAALLLYEIVSPKLMRPGWPQSARWPYIGVPETLVVELLGDPGGNSDGFAGIPVVHPETVWVDHGKIFLSRAFRDACVRLGINLQLARPYTPTDKAFIERIFRTIREDFVEYLPGYKGPDLFSRGRNPETEAFYFFDEIDEAFAEWVATYWQNRPHGGLKIDSIPKLELTPNEMYEESLTRTGFVYLAPQATLYYTLLPTAWRHIHHYGIELSGVQYDGAILNEYRNQKSPYKEIHNGKWALKFDPRDLSKIYFYSPELREWHVINRVSNLSTNYPFDHATLSYAKCLLVKRNAQTSDHPQLVDVLDQILEKLNAQAFTDKRERKIAAVNAIRTMRSKKDSPKSKLQTSGSSSVPVNSANTTEFAGDKIPVDDIDLLFDTIEYEIESMEEAMEDLKF